jgi:hypothetical protein
MLATGAVVGGLWIAIAGALRARRGVNETISTLLLNYIGIALLNHLVEGPLRDPASLNKPSTLPIGDDNMLGSLPGLDVHWVCDVPCVDCVAADHPLAKKRTIRLKDLDGQRLLTMANPYRLRRRIEEALERAGVRPQEMIETNASLNAVAMARQSLGVAIVEPVLTSHLEMTGIVTRRLDVPIPFLFAAITPAGHELTPTVAALNAALRAAAALMPGARLRDGTAALAEVADDARQIERTE